MWMTHTPNQAPDGQGADEFHLAMNSTHPKIKFEIEKPIQLDNGLSLALLDLKVTIKASGDTEFDLYRKPARKPTFVHFKSAIPRNTKNATIRTSSLFYHLTANQLTSQTTYTDPIKRNTATEKQLHQ